MCSPSGGASRPRTALTPYGWSPHARLKSSIALPYGPCKLLLPLRRCCRHRPCLRNLIVDSYFIAGATTGVRFSRRLGVQKRGSWRADYVAPPDADRPGQVDRRVEARHHRHERYRADQHSCGICGSMNTCGSRSSLYSGDQPRATFPIPTSVASDGHECTVVPRSCPSLWYAEKFIPHTLRPPDLL